ncbi:MAG: hypothetical protein WA484_10560 [Solirubrobacteraceae bacterium]
MSPSIVARSVLVSSVAVRLNDHVTLAAKDVESLARFYARLGLTRIVEGSPV